MISFLTQIDSNKDENSNNMPLLAVHIILPGSEQTLGKTATW
jgi:hypothetical protein